MPPPHFFYSGRVACAERGQWARVVRQLSSDDCEKMLRHDLTTDSWVLLAPGRARRPHDTSAAATQPAAKPVTVPDIVKTCPFCPGNEEQTPPEVAALRDESGWRVRVIPNLYPAIAGSDSPSKQEGEPPFRHLPPIGAHEVIIESPHHSRTISAQEPSHVTALLHVLQERQRAYEADQRLSAVTIFRNQGKAAGASLAHPHWQLLATPVVPPDLARRDGVSRRYVEAYGRTLLADLLGAEQRAGERIVEENEEFTAWVPYAARFPYETWLAPHRPANSLVQLDDAARRGLGELLPRVVGRLGKVLGNPDYNIVSVSAPGCARRETHFGFHLQILPRIASPAGFELGSGMWINSKPPEDAARELREAGAGP